MDAPLNQPKVSIIILNWNSYEVTRDCLHSLRKIDYRNYEVLIVDNGSVDSSADQLQREFPEVRMVRNAQNLGFTGGNNVGMRDALSRGADYLLLLNNDTIVAPDFLSKLVAVAEGQPTVGMINPKIYYYEPPDRIWYAGGQYEPWRTFPKHFGLRQRDVGLYNQKREVSFITGCALLIKAEVVRKIGLLDEIFFLSFEDADWSIRALEAGYKGVYVPESVIWHRDSYVTEKSLGLARREFYNMRNTVLCARKHILPKQVPLFILSLGKYIAYGTVRSLFAADWKRVAALYHGAWTGWRTPMPHSNLSV